MLFSTTLKSVLPFLFTSFVVLIMVRHCSAVGGIAELKALTGDAPYLGIGNQEQAPEFFGDALVRQYYQNPAYRFNDWYGGSRFAQNYYRTPYHGGGGYGGGDWQGLSLPIASYRPTMSSLFGGQRSTVSSVAFGSGGFYHGRGNDWVNK